MANTYQSSNVRANTGATRRPEYLGTPALMAPSPITGNMVLTTLAVHTLPDGAYAVVNGTAITVMDDGEIDAINASMGYQSVSGETLLNAIRNAQGVYTCDVNCGGIFGVQDGRLVHLAPDDARGLGVELTRVVHTLADGSSTVLEGVIAISVSAYLALIESANPKVATPPQITFRQPKAMDVHPLADGLRLARAGNPLAEAEVTNAAGETVIIRAFPRGTQRSEAAEARRQEAMANSPLANIGYGRRVAPKAQQPQANPASAYRPNRNI